MLPRRAEHRIEQLLATFPAVLLLGARQVGKTTLARKIASCRSSVFFDLEDQDARDSLRLHPVAKLCRHDGKLIVIDEVQKVPEIFEAIRVAIDRLDPDVPGKFLLLGSASGRLLNQTKENLFGRVGALELFGFDCLETHADSDLLRLWDRGGFPRSYLADSDNKSLLVRQNMCQQMFASNNLADIAASRVSAESLARLLTHLARQQGGVANIQEIAGFLEIDRRTASQYITMLTDMMLVRRLPAFARVGGASQAVKPKYYIRDSGILHCLGKMTVRNKDSSALSNLRGVSWEGFVIESIMAVLPPLWQASFYRSHNRYEIDLVLQKPDGGIWAIEIKSALNAHDATLSRANRKAIELLQPEKCFVVHGGERGQAMLAGDIEVVSLSAIMNELLAQDAQPPAGSAQHLASRPQSSVQAALLSALESAQPNAALLRDKFVDFCLQRAEEIFTPSRTIDNAIGQRDWRQLRTEMVEWLALECKLDGALGSACSRVLATSIKRMLQGILTLKLTAPTDGGGISQADLGSWEILVHCIAVLLDCEKFTAIFDLLDYKYMAAGKLHECSRFCYPATGMIKNASPDQARETATQLHEHGKAGTIATTRLIEAEQVIFCHAVKTQADQTIYPHILTRVPLHDLSPLEFFMRVQTAQGRIDLLDCLKEPEEAFSLAGFATTIASRMEELLANDQNRYRKWHQIMAIDNWP